MLPSSKALDCAKIPPILMQLGQLRPDNEHFFVFMGACVGVEKEKERERASERERERERRDHEQEVEKNTPRTFTSEIASQLPGQYEDLTEEKPDDEEREEGEIGPMDLQDDRRWPGLRPAAAPPENESEPKRFRLRRKQGVKRKDPEEESATDKMADEEGAACFWTNIDNAIEISLELQLRGGQDQAWTI